MKKFKAILITIDIFKTDAPILEGIIKSYGIAEYVRQSVRLVSMREVRGLSSLFRSHDLDEDPVERFSVTAGKFPVQEFLDKVMAALHLSIPGRGAIFVEEVDVACQDKSEEFDGKTYADIPYLLNDLMRIRAVVQRGQGNNLAETALDYGLSVPTVSFGTGAGLRETLGLVRITIPIEKEVVDVVVNRTDAQDLFNALVEEGHLDQPGKGFIYMTPVLEGMVNPLVFRGKQRHAASMEQIIHAIDLIKGDPEWRRRMVNARKEKANSRKYIENMSEMVLTCNEGFGGHFMKIAAEAGASGSTIQLSKTFAKIGNEYEGQAIEECHLVVPHSNVENLLKVLGQAELFTEKSGGCMVIRSAPLACTYLGK